MIILFLFFDTGTGFPVDFGHKQNVITLSATSSFVPFFSKSNTSQITLSMGRWKFRLQLSNKIITINSLLLLGGSHLSSEDSQTSNKTDNTNYQPSTACMDFLFHYWKIQSITRGVHLQRVCNHCAKFEYC